MSPDHRTAAIANFDNSFPNHPSDRGARQPRHIQTRSIRVRVVELDELRELDELPDPNRTAPELLNEE